MRPLTSWTCDVCGGKIKIAEGVMIARAVDEDHLFADFKIVHKSMGGRSCDPGSRSPYIINLDLDRLVGLDGATRLLGFLSAGPMKNLPGSSRVADLDEWVDLFRRFQIPFYEEARGRFGDEHVVDDYADANEYLPYMERSLKSIAEAK